MTASVAALEGIRVADFSHNRAGLVCAMLLGDMGAEVIKIEAPPTIGTLRMVGFPVKLSRTPPTLTLYPPRYGEHTDEILRELGCSPEEIAAARAEVGPAAARGSGGA